MFRIFGKKTRLAISMSGGGAKSTIYLGVLKALQENSITPTILAGLSGGALIGGLLAAGKSVEEIIEIATSVHFSRLVERNPFHGEILSQEKVYEFIKGLVGDKQVEDCSPQLVIFATDFNARKVEVIKTGELASAMLASCCIPPLLTPIVREGKLLGEGGFSVLYGAKYIRECGADIVIGADVDGFKSGHLPSVAQTLKDGISALIRSNGDYEMQIYPVDLEITDFPDNTGMFDFQKLGLDLVEVGYKHTMAYMPQIRHLMRV